VNTVELFDRRDADVEIHSDVSLMDSGDIVMSGYEVDRSNPAETEEWRVAVPAQAVPRLDEALRGLAIAAGKDTLTATAHLILARRTSGWPRPSQFFRWLEEHRIPYSYRLETPTGNDVAIDFDGETVHARRAGRWLPDRTEREVIEERRPPRGPR